MVRPRLLAFVVVASIAVAACGNSKDTSAPATTVSTVPGATTTTADLTKNVKVDEKGVTDTEIKYTSIAVKSNNILGTNISGAFNDGIKAYFAWRNDGGGIYGRKLVLAKQRDDELVANDREAKAMVSEDDSFGVFNAPLQARGYEDLAKAGIPTYTWGIHGESAGYDNFFGHMGQICFGCITHTQVHLARSVQAKAVAVLGYKDTENSLLCSDGLKQSFEKFGPELGMKLTVFDDALSFGLVNGLAPQVTKMKETNVKFVTACMDLNGMKTLADELHKQGLDDVVLSHPNTYNVPFVKAAGGLFEGDFIAAQFVPYELNIDSEMQRKFFEYTDKLKIKREELTMIGFIAADQAYQSLVNAGPEFTRAKAIAGMNTVTDYNADGLIVSIDWTKQHADPKKDTSTRGIECFSPVKVVNDAFVPAFKEQTAETPFLCWKPSDNSKWTEPEPMSFASSK